MHAPIVTQKPNFGSRYGNNKNIGRVGITYQKVYYAWFAIFSSGWFSMNNQVSVSKVISGNAAIKPPNLSLRFATSLMNTTIPAVSKYLVMIQVMMPP